MHLTTEKHHSSRELLRHFYLTAQFALIAAVAVALDRDVRKAPRHCEPRSAFLSDRLPGSPVIVAASVNATVVLLCSFCGEEDAAGDDAIGAVWRVDDLVNGTGSRPVQLEQKRGGKLARLAHHDKRRVFLGDRHELVLRGVSEERVGLYSCSHLQGVDRGRPFQYLVDLDRGGVPAVRGSRADYRAYRRTTLEPLSASLRAAGVPLEAAAAWGPWGLCANCSRGDGSGSRERLAECRLRVPPVPPRGRAVDLGAALRVIIGDPLSALPCRSALLAATLASKYRGGWRAAGSTWIQDISALSKDAADFVEVDTVSCDGHCAPPPRRRLPWRPAPPRPVPRVDYELQEGDDLVVLCPGATMESDVHWDRDGMELEDPAGHETARLVAPTTTKKPGILQRWRQRRKKLKALVRRRGRRLQPSARVDWTGALRLEAASVDESGLYSCSLVDGITALAADIRVVRRKSFTISDVSRHASYLLGVILLCLMVYLTVVAIACRLYPRRQQGYRPLQLSSDDADRASDHDETAEREGPVRLSARRGDGLAATTLVQRRPISASSLAASICLTDERRSSSTSSSPTNGTRGTSAASGFVTGSSSEQDGGSLRLRSLLRPRPGVVAKSLTSALTMSSNEAAAADERLDEHPPLAASVCLVEDKAISSGEQEEQAVEPALSQAD